ncbi:MAG TPA: CPBP family intramembrane glutamic endopeptidase [Candidatus Limnocylindrales bacterium]|nr:CPBP family intramembrane glutamic endopeptidase [Candidatus Limnocylindrales bacterium]
MSRRRLLVLALAFEGAVFLLALAAAASTGTSLGGRARVGPTAALAGLLAGGALAGLALAALRVRWGPLARLARVVREMSRRFFQDATIVDLVVISALAGVAEEALFRGAIQTAVSETWGPTAGIAAGALVFGLAHAVTAAYAVAAGLIGVVLGILLEATGDLAAPILCHALYDLVVLWFLRRNSLVQST